MNHKTLSAVEFNLSYPLTRIPVCWSHSQQRCLPGCSQRCFANTHVVAQGHKFMLWGILKGGVRSCNASDVLLTRSQIIVQADVGTSRLQFDTRYPTLAIARVDKVYVTRVQMERRAKCLCMKKQTSFDDSIQN
jgi:hypothetical protein